MEADFCVDALREAAARWGAPQIVNTDQGSQFSSAEFVAEVQRMGARQSMDGKGCWRDNVFVERLWRSVKYEDVYLKAYDGVSEARQSLAAYFEFYNARRPHVRVRPAPLLPGLVIRRRRGAEAARTRRATSARRSPAWRSAG